MGSTVKIPADITLAEVARRLGLKTEDCRGKLPDLYARGFPQPDPVTYRFDPEAVERWRRLRNPGLFPELSRPQLAKDAKSINIADRIAAL